MRASRPRAQWGEVLETLPKPTHGMADARAEPSDSPAGRPRGLHRTISEPREVGVDGPRVTAGRGGDPATGEGDRSGRVEAPGAEAGPCDGTPGATGGIRRLSNAELLGTYRALFGDIEGQAFKDAFRLLPEDASRDPGLDFDNDQFDVEALYAVADVLVAQTLQDESLRARVLGPCTDPASDQRCLDGVIDRFAPRAFRRRLTAQEQQRLRDHASDLGGRDGVRFTMIRLLMSPEFSHHLELGLEAPAQHEGAIALSSREVAARVAYQLTGAPPDDRLVAAADAGELSSVGELEVHARRLLGTSAARQKLRSVVSHWLALSAVPDPAAPVAAHLGFAPEGFGAEARDELLRFAEYMLFERAGTLQQLLTDRTAFPSSPRLALVYSLPQTEGPSTFDDVRGGLLLRAAPLLSSATHSLPITRGLFVRSRLLCQQLGAPDAAVLAAGIAASEALSRQEYSGREIVAEVTASPPCQGCHSQLNPIGFALEQLGPAGDFRTEEVVLDDAGAVLATHPIDSEVADLGLGGGSAQPAAGARDLVRLLAETEQVGACFAFHLVANTRMRPPAAADACVIAETQSALREGTVLDAVVANVANEDAFWRSAP